MTRQSSINPTDSLAILDALDEAIRKGAAPFLSVAAEQCGLNPEIVAYWYHAGRRGDPACESFYKLVAKKRADWKVWAQARVLNAKQTDATRVSYIKYMLSVMDRDLFDLTKRVDLDKKDKREPGRVMHHDSTPEDLEKAIEELTQKGQPN